MGSKSNKKSASGIPTCVVDNDVLNKNTVGKMDDIGLSIFAKLCGMNRGVFVLDPPDGKTYGCTSFPEVFSTNADVPSWYTVKDSAHFTQSFKTGELTAEQTVDIIDQYVSTVYQSSVGNSDNPYGCEVNGLAKLENCPSTTDTPRSLRQDGDIVKSVTLAGAFVPEEWVTGGRVLSMEEVLDFYSYKEFKNMSKLGVNTVQIPVPCNAFIGVGEIADTITTMLKDVSKAGLNAILTLVETKNADEQIITMTESVNDRITAAAKFANDAPAIIAIQLPSPLPSLVSAARAASTTLPVLVPVNKGELASMGFPPDRFLFAALDVGASTSVADVASSDSEGDRMKMFYHENIVCIDRSPIEYLDCYRDMPVYVTSGFDLAVDNCINKDDENFEDYGQCNRFDETIGSGWWERHRQSLASRQLFTYSKGLGFSFSGWKLYGDDDDESIGKIDSPEKLLCLRDVAAAGLLPPIDSIGNSTLNEACLNGPKADFAMGDKTLAPTPAPPPDCGNGWWNYTINDCSYWIPPPPTPQPTAAPFACPSCETQPLSTKYMVSAALVGAVAALVLNWLVKKMFGRGDGYSSLP